MDGMYRRMTMARRTFCFRYAFRAALLILITSFTGCGGSVETTPGDAANVDSGTATLTWTAPTTNADGAPLTGLAGYVVYYGVTPGIYSSQIVGNVNSYEVVGLTKGLTYYFTVTAYNTYGYQSDYAAVVSKLIM